MLTKAERGGTKEGDRNECPRQGGKGGFQTKVDGRSAKRGTMDNHRKESITGRLTRQDDATNHASVFPVERSKPSLN